MSDVRRLTPSIVLPGVSKRNSFSSWAAVRSKNKRQSRRFVGIAELGAVRLGSEPDGEDRYR
jgi:hypothetical protein